MNNITIPNKAYINQKGNILFIILIAVSLFALLSYTVTQSGRTTGTAIENEKTKITQSELDSYTAQINQGKNRLQLINNCKTIDYTAPADQVAGDKSCHLFHPDGAGVAYRDLLDECSLKNTVAESSNLVVWELNEAWYSVSPAVACGGCASESPTSCTLGEDVTVSVGIHNCQDHPNSFFAGTWYVASHWCGGNMRIYCHSTVEAPCGGDRDESNFPCDGLCGRN